MYRVGILVFHQEKLYLQTFREFLIPYYSVSFRFVECKLFITSKLLIRNKFYSIEN